jgi:hypothetical protein
MPEADSQQRGRSMASAEDMPGQRIVAGYGDPNFADAINTRLDELSRLQPNWDGYGAPTIDPRILAATRTFVRSLPAPLALHPRIVPLSPGNLQFEWHAGTKILELEFEDPRTIHYLQWNPEHGVEEEDTFPVTDIDRAVDLIQWFLSRDGA